MDLSKNRPQDKDPVSHDLVEGWGVLKGLPAQGPAGLKRTYSMLRPTVSRRLHVPGPD